MPRSRGGNVGVGLSLGDPLGFSFKVFLAPNHALQADLGWALLHHYDGRLGVDYLWHPLSFVSNGTLELVPYLGIGLGLMFWAPYHGRYCGPDDRYDRYYYRGWCGHGRYDRDGRYYESGGAALFIRAPVLGLGIHWKKIPIDTMLEGSWSPYVILPDLAHGDFSFKARYYF